jgi:hypothetical protein
LACELSQNQRLVIRRRARVAPSALRALPAL